jgi:transposase
MNGERFERHRALVEDIAYSGMSAQEIAEKYGLSQEGIQQFSSTWAKDEVADLIRRQGPIYSPYSEGLQWGCVSTVSAT